MRLFASLERGLSNWAIALVECQGKIPHMRTAQHAIISRTRLPS
jgi:hypothetical protein